MNKLVTSVVGRISKFFSREKVQAAIAEPPPAIDTPSNGVDRSILGDIVHIRFNNPKPEITP